MGNSAFKVCSILFGGIAFLLRTVSSLLFLYLIYRMMVWIPQTSQSLFDFKEQMLSEMLELTPQRKLEHYHQSMIGNIYADNKQKYFAIGHGEITRSVVKIINEDTLSFQSGLYSTSFEQESQQIINHAVFVSGETIYKEEDVSEPVLYEYVLSIDLIGRVTISFNGKSYPVDIEDDNVQGIDFYSE